MKSRLFFSLEHKATRPIFLFLTFERENGFIFLVSRTGERWHCEKKDGNMGGCIEYFFIYPPTSEKSNYLSVKYKSAPFSRSAFLLYQFLPKIKSRCNQIYK
jgi:hypothetical protein